eukprot:15430097-Heterocapsa_arctica.AAC.1
MYGTQDAANVWMDTWGDALCENGVKTGASSPSVFVSEFLRGFCNGDDSCVVACREDLEVRRTGMIGFQGNCDTDLNILNRTVRVLAEKDMIELEPDAKHGKQLLEELGLQNTKSQVTPRVKISVDEPFAGDDSPLLDAASATAFRSATM